MIMNQIFFTSPLFGILLTVLVSWQALWLRKKIKWSLYSPMLFSMITIVGILLVSGIPFESYNAGGTYIMKLLGPLTVVLAVPLYQNHHHLKKYFFAITFGIILGSLFAITIVYLFSILLGLDMVLLRSLLVKSITTPIGIATTEMIEGIVGVSVLSIVMTGVFGAILSEVVFKVFHIENPIARGVALGTGAHAVGTGKALEYGKIEGAMAGLSIAIAGIATVVWAMLFKSFGLIV
jgi:putative effector of murein hydrolase